VIEHRAMTSPRESGEQARGDSVGAAVERPPVDTAVTVLSLDKVQRGLQPDDFKPMPTIGKGVEEIRIRDDSGIYRVIYTARFADAVLVLHAFEKKSQRTSQRDIEIARARFREMMRDRR
jgi:phage-related protein